MNLEARLNQTDVYQPDEFLDLTCRGISPLAYVAVERAAKAGQPWVVKGALPYAAYRGTPAQLVTVYAVDLNPALALVMRPAELHRGEHQYIEFGLNAHMKEYGFSPDWLRACKGMLQEGRARAGGSGFILADAFCTLLDAEIEKKEAAARAEIAAKTYEAACRLAMPNPRAPTGRKPHADLTPGTPR